MSLAQIIIESLESLNSNKLRSSLTILGIVIGVAAVIAMLAIGQGAQDTITGEISGIGTNLLFVFSGNDQANVRNVRPLTLGDMEALKDHFVAPSLSVVAPIIQDQNVKVTSAKAQATTSIIGATPEYEIVLNLKVFDGEFITSEHYYGCASVVLLGKDIAQKLFDHTEGLVGEMVRIEGQPFRVIGILQSRGGSALGSEDNVVLIPLSTARARIINRPGEHVDVIFVQAVSADVVPQAVEEISQILRTRHRTEIGYDDFTIFTQKDLLQSATAITNVFVVFLGGIAAISLLVGGIGIMNIMLVSVIERTREVGLRKALGARRKNILLQFLAEASVLSLTGGIFGFFLGWLIALMIGWIASFIGTPFNPRVSISAVLLAILFSIAVGLFFGIYPANRAAALEPVEALRHE